MNQKSNITYEVDDTDREILKLLQEDAKITVKEIKEKINKSPTAIRERIKKLEKNIIKKYAAIIDCSKLGYREMVLASIRVNNSIPLENLKTEIQQINEIKYSYVTTGEYPIFTMFKCLGHDDALGVIEKIRNLSGVEEIKTQIVLERIKEDHTIIIP